MVVEVRFSEGGRSGPLDPPLGHLQRRESSVAAVEFVCAPRCEENALDVPQAWVRHIGLDEPLAQPPAPVGFERNEITQSGKGWRAR